MKTFVNVMRLEANRGEEMDAASTNIESGDKGGALDNEFDADFEELPFVFDPHVARLLLGQPELPSNPEQMKIPLEVEGFYFWIQTLEKLGLVESQPDPENGDLSIDSTRQLRRIMRSKGIEPVKV